MERQVMEFITPVKLTNPDVLFLCKKTFRRILSNEDSLSKGEICDKLRELEGFLSQYS